DALHVVQARRPTHVVEIGPRPVLIALARRAGLRDALMLPCCPGERADGGELGTVAAALYRAGAEIDFTPLYQPGQRTLRRLPPHVFADNARFWASAATIATTTIDTGSTSVTAPAPRGATRPAPGSPFTDVGARVLAAIAAVGDYSVDDLHTGTRLRDDLGYDSIMVMQLGDLLADLLTGDDPLPVHDLLPRISTVGDLVSFVADRWQGSTAH
ncbi:MAG TPA: phosphopantetheine-binding protein, partial [Pseudonocardiaceae bacterium]